MDKKILFICIALLTIWSCSTTDDLETQNVSKNTENVLTTLNKSGNIGTETPTNQDYGMPFDDQYLEQDGLIKLVYAIHDDSGKIDIRRKFSRKHPQLVLAKVATSRSPVEYWFFKPKGGQNSGGAQPIAGEDDDINNGPAELIIIITEIKNHELIDLYCVECYD